jgi:hypothetical protein
MPTTTDGQVFEIRVSGPVPAAVVAELEGVDVVAEEVRTVVNRHFPDQAALHEFLRTARGLGLEVVEVRRMAHDPTPAPTGDRA